MSRRPTPLEDLRECLRSSLSRIGTPVIATDTDNRITFLNPEAEALTGWRSAEALGRPCVLHMVDEVSGEALEEPIDRVLRKGEAVDLPEHAALRLRGGHSVSVEGSASPLRAADGRVFGALVVLRDIRSQRETMAALRELNERYELVLAGADAGLWDWDVSAGRVIYSPRWKAMRGYLDHEIGDSLEEWSRRIHPDDAPRILAAVQAHFDGETPVFAEEYRVRCKDGSWMWIADHGLARRDADGQVLRMAGSERDVSERKEAERALAASEEKFRGAFAHAAIGMAIEDLGGRLLEFNQAYCAIVGESAEALQGRSFQGFVHPDDVADNLALQGRLLAGELPSFVIENRYIRRDGAAVWVRKSVSLIRDADGAPQRFLALVEDISERKRSEDALRESEERLRLFIEHAPVALAMFDRDMRYLAVSRRWCRDYDLHDDDLIGRSHYEVFPEIGEAWKAVHRRALAGEVIRADDERFDRADGSVQWLRWEVRPWRGSDGAVGGIVLFSEDISARKLAEEALRALNDELAETDRRKDEFLAMLAHELRNPLAAIFSAVQLIGQLEIDHPLLERARQAADRQSRHMIRLLDDLLDLSRVSQRRVALSREVVDVASFIEAAIEAATPQLRARGQAIAVTLPEAPLRVHGDPVRLAQVVGNLLSNASRYTPIGGHIWVSAALEGRQAALRVRDDGAGIAPELLPHVFDLFFQGDAPPGDTQCGLGIGLTVVKRLVELHGGEIQVRSDGVGEGSEFTIRLPAWAGAGAIASPACPAGSHQCPLRVLLVDDNADVVDMLALMLKGRGYEVAVAYDGADALAQAARRRPDVIVLDIGMPQMDGHEVARRLREDPELRGVPLIALTGYGQAEDQARARAAGFGHHLTKPVTIEALEGALKSAASDR